MDQARRGLAWCYVDGVVLGLSALIGVGAWIAACIGVTADDPVGGVAPWMNLGIGGLIVFGAGNALWLLRGRRAVGLLRASLVACGSGHPQQQAQASRDLEDSIAMRVRLPIGGLVHRSDCPLVAGKPVVPGHAADGQSCGVCSP